MPIGSPCATCDGLWNLPLKIITENYYSVDKMSNLYMYTSQYSTLNTFILTFGDFQAMYVPHIS